MQRHCMGDTSRYIIANKRYTQCDFKLKLNTHLKEYNVKYTKNHSLKNNTRLTRFFNPTKKKRVR